MCRQHCAKAWPSVIEAYSPRAARVRISVAIRAATSGKMYFSESVVRTLSSSRSRARLVIASSLSAIAPWLASGAAAERRYVAEVRRPWIVGRFDRVSTIGADGCGIDLLCAWKLCHDPVLGAASADEPAELRLLGLTPRAQCLGLLFGHAHFLLPGWACRYNARTGSIIGYLASS